MVANWSAIGEIGQLLKQHLEDPKKEEHKKALEEDELSAADRFAAEKDRLLEKYYKAKRVFNEMMIREGLYKYEDLEPNRKNPRIYNTPWLATKARRIRWMKRELKKEDEQKARTRERLIRYKKYEEERIRRGETTGQARRRRRRKWRMEREAKEAAWRKANPEAAKAKDLKREKANQRYENEQRKLKQAKKLALLNAQKEKKWKAEQEKIKRQLKLAEERWRKANPEKVKAMEKAKEKAAEQARRKRFLIYREAARKIKKKQAWRKANPEAAKAEDMRRQKQFEALVKAGDEKIAREKEIKRQKRKAKKAAKLKRMDLLIAKFLENKYSAIEHIF